VPDFPNRLTFIDVETTGLHSNDRVVSLGVVQVDMRGVSSGALQCACEHLIFDPEKKSHPQAERVHGYDDWTLRHQDLFEEHAERLRTTFDNPHLIWAHNAPFDQRFIYNEFSRAGRPLPEGTFGCTMQLYRSRHYGRASLNSILGEIGINRQSAHHSALEDAWMAMIVYLWLHGINARQSPPLDALTPSNLKEVPPLVGELPRRNKKAKRAGLKPIEPVSSGEVISRIVAGCRPLASMLLYIAKADEEFRESEWAILAELMTETASFVGATPGPNDMIDAVAYLEENPMPLDEAAKMIWGDERARSTIAQWVRKVTYADSIAHPKENEAISEVARLLQEARG